MELPRRTVLLLGVGVLVGGCSSSRPTVSPGSHQVTPSAPGTHAVSPTPVPLPAVTTWRPDARDVEPAAKLAAVRHVERTRTSASSSVQVIDAQYGGILPTSASVLVVTRSWTRRGFRIDPGGRTYDVRLELRSGTWRVTAVHPSFPGPVARHSPTARRVLAHDRIDLPPAARRDVLSGQVHDSVLAAMLRLAASYRIGVSVVRSGHPTYVFGTDRLSDHPRGRAFDTWRIDGHPVVDARTPRSLVTDYMQAAAAAGSYNVGGPYLLGAAPQWFSDQTHHDHVRAGFAE